MKKPIVSLREGLIYHLRGLFDAEHQIQRAIPLCIEVAQTPELKREMRKYATKTGEKIMKLERVFNYMMAEPGGRKSRVMEELINDTHFMLERTDSAPIRDAMLIACMQNTNHYKIAGYGTAVAFARNLNLDIGIDLLEEVLSWEKETNRNLSSIALESVNEKALESDKNVHVQHESHRHG
jgi:ferritin-like metal-binding protein YciE